MRIFSSSLYKNFKFFLINKYFKPACFLAEASITILDSKNVSTTDFQIQKIPEGGKHMSFCVRILEQTLTPYTCLGQTDSLYLSGADTDPLHLPEQTLAP